MTYAEKLKDPRWQKKRLKILERDEFGCALCGDDTTTLHVHHIAYSKGDPWDIDDSLLKTLCEGCHQHEEQELHRLKYTLINELRNVGFPSYMINAIPKIFKDTNRGWNGYEPCIDIIKFAVDNDGLWDQLTEMYFNHLHERALLRNKEQLPY